MYLINIMKFWKEVYYEKFKIINFVDVSIS